MNTTLKEWFNNTQKSKLAENVLILRPYNI